MREILLGLVGLMMAGKLHAHALSVTPFVGIMTNEALETDDIGDLPAYIGWFGLQPTTEDRCGRSSLTVNIHIAFRDVAQFGSVRLISPSGVEQFNSESHPNRWQVGAVPSAVYGYGAGSPVVEIETGIYSVELRSKSGVSNFLQIPIEANDIIRASPVIRSHHCGGNYQSGFQNIRWEDFRASLPAGNRKAAIYMFSNNKTFFDNTGAMTNFVFQSFPGPGWFGVMYESWRYFGPRISIVSSSVKIVDFAVQ
jgi:hypothetical protein